MKKLSDVEREELLYAFTALLNKYFTLETDTYTLIIRDTESESSFVASTEESLIDILPELAKAAAELQLNADGAENTEDCSVLQLELKLDIPENEQN